MFHSFLILILVLAIMTLVIQSFRSPFPTSTRILKKLQILASTRDTGREQGRKNYSSKPNTSASSSSSTNNKTAKASGTKNNLNVQKATKQGKEEKTKESHQIITRDITDTSERRSLGSLRVGEKLSGKIMTIVKHGFFMDVGSTKDGLVHVKDISKDYFVHNLVNKYSPGQVVDVWVKFVDAATNKLGLQMFPISEDDASKSPQSKVDNLRKSLIFFPSETSVSGTVVKVSDLGVYVDVGASVTAFLPKRKMKLTKKQMKFKPWEVHPLNSQLNALVHESDKTRNRISLTTYAVVDWEEKLPNKDFIIKNGMVEDDEELGGSTRASIANMRALQNTLQLDPDEDDDEDDDDGEDLSAAEINALTGGRHKSQLLIDETAQSNSKSDKGKKSTSSPVSSELNVLGEGQDTDDEEEEDRRVMPTGEDEMFGEEMSTEELFDELSQGRPYLTLKEIKKWDYLKDFLDNGDVDEAKLKELISESGGSGKLNVEQLDTFIDLLVENLGLTEMDEDGYDEDEEEEEDAVRDLITGGSSKKVDIEGEDLLLIDDFSVSDRPSAQLVSSSLPKATSSTTSTTTNADDTSDLDSDDMEVRLERPDPSKGFGITNKNLKKQQQASLEEMFEKKSTTNDLLQYIFVDLAGEKGHVNLNDILNWEFAQALVEQNGITRDGLIKVFDQYANPRDKKVDRNAFEKILDKLSDIDLLASPEDSTKKVIATSQQVNKEVVLPHGKVVLKTASEQSSPDLILADPIPTISRGFSAEGTMNILSEDFDFENGAGDDLLADLEFEQITVEDAFKKLADGKTFITLDPLLSWDIVSELLEDGVIDAQKVKELFNQAGAKKGKLSYEGFEQFIDLLMPYADFEDDDENIVVDMSELEAIDDDEEDNDESEENNNDEPTPTLVNIQASPRIVGNKPTNAPFTTDSRPMKPEELESLDDETILKNVFQALSGGKGHVSLKDLLNWDFVLDLFGEGLLDEEELVFMMSDCGGHRKGVDLPAFDKLVDSLVEKYSELEGDEDEDTDNESTNGMSIADDNKIADSIFEGSDEGNESSELRDDEDVLDIDVGEAFDKLSKGKNFVTLRSFMKWDVVSTLIREGYLVEGEIEEMLELIKVEDSDRMDIVTFENLVTELASRFTADDDEDDDDGDESDDLNTDEFADIDESGNIMSMNESTTDNESDDNDKGSEAEGDVFGDDDDTYDTNTEQLLKDLKSLIDKEESEAKGRNKK